MITDSRHARQIRNRLHQCVDTILDCWLEEQHAASVPPVIESVSVSGGTKSDPTASLGTMDPDRREKDARRLGAQITGTLDSMERLVTAWTPRLATDVPPCVNCGASPGVWRNARCVRCGPWYQEQGVDRDPAEAKKHMERLHETRPCRVCGEPIRLTEGRRKCRGCSRAA